MTSHTTLLNRACAYSYENLPKYRSYRVILVTRPPGANHVTLQAIQLGVYLQNATVLDEEAVGYSMFTADCIYVTFLFWTSVS